MKIIKWYYLNKYS